MTAVLKDENPGLWIEEQCRELDLSLARVAREAKVSRMTIFRWRRETTKRPYWDSVRRVETVLKSYWDRRDSRAG